MATTKKQTQSDFSKLQEAIEKMKKGSFQQDEREWKLTRDPADNGFAIIRFLPAPKGEEDPFVRLWNHWFQGPYGQWYVENSLTTIKEADPVSEYNSKLWKSGVEANKDIARKYKRKLTYISNIFVVKDAAKPECEGNIYLFKYGKRIFDKLSLAVTPPDESIEAFNPFDLREGANFQLIARKVDGQINYDNSSFSPRAPLFKDDKKIEAVLKAAYPLLPFIAKDQFKPYAELKAKLNRVLGLGETIFEPRQDPVDQPSEEPSTGPVDNEDDNSSYFASLATED